MFGEGLELQRVEGVLPAADVLHRVLPPAALAEETQTRVGGVRKTQDEQKGVNVGDFFFNFCKKLIQSEQPEVCEFSMSRHKTFIQPEMRFLTHNTVQV